MSQEGRDNSDAGLEGDLMGKPWTIDEVRTRALSLGKTFKPNAEIIDQLAGDLATNGVIVLFTVDEVKSAVSKGAIPKEYEGDLVSLVDQNGLNDIAVIPAGAIEDAKRQKFVDWFLTNNRC